MSFYRFIHLSDIHFGQERDGTLVTHNAVREELLNDCNVMRERLQAAHGVLVSGDTVYSGKKEEYTKAGEWLDRLTSAIGCKRKAVLLIPGNHDVDLDEIDHTAKMLHQQLRTSSPNVIQADLEGLGSGNADHPLHRKLKAYTEFAEQYGCVFESPTRPLWQKDFAMGNGHTLRFVGLNSVQVSDKLDAKHLMVLGNAQYTISRQANIEYFVMIHHPFEWFRDRVQAEQFLHSRARVLMFGHEHLAAISKHVDENNHERLVIDSGATNPPETGGEYRFTYNWIEISVHAKDGGNFLSVRIYPRVWVEGRTAFAADSARMSLDARESKEFVLACAQFQSPPDEAPAASTNPSLSGAQANAEGGVPMADDEEENFGRLRFFFWRYLDWRQRLKILVESDVLPHTADRPVPQTMERLALSSARSQGKLAEVWDAVMKLMPDETREPNPFNQPNKKE